ncbi:hypothetical protein A4R44_03887 [Amycolatopsis sp. M39]|uniref:Uncharacterized protein n=1 Tax=Amycolatopsis rubida TaxID=112413 RepID=A0A1I5ZFV8_9PSEU|nr:hypothetical protein A4R44_03887 [Amycolatopsis sp. M39]SFQ55322.1 hypothetical protein SAMN05421854_11537 [Amycolatopsis rubida]
MPASSKPDLSVPGNRAELRACRLPAGWRYRWKVLRIARQRVLRRSARMPEPFVPGTRKHQRDAAIRHRPMAGDSPILHEQLQI